MSLPHRIIPGSSYLLTRRCLERRFLLRPDRLVNQIVEFCIAEAAARTGVEVHAFCAMSNHLHIVVTDPEGRVSEFAQWLHRHVALCLNAHHRRRGVVWEPGRFRPVLLAQSGDVLAKLVYTLLNPVKDALVPYGDEWPGARSRVEELGVLEKVVRRPKVYFSSTEEGSVPETATLRLTVPPGFSDDEELRREVGQRLEAEEKHHRQTIKGNFVGARQVERMSIEYSPPEPEPEGELSPWIACQDEELRTQLLEELQAFWSSYRDAYRRYRAKEHDVVFPLGTYWLRVQLRVRCETAPT